MPPESVHAESLDYTTTAGTKPSAPTAHFAVSTPPEFKYAVASASLKGEDKFLADPQRRHPDSHNARLPVFGVFDGHGGGECAEYCVGNLADNVLNCMKVGTEFSTDLALAVINGFVNTNATFNASGATAGTTATLMLLDHWKLVVGWVGDSRALFISNDGSWEALTRDHRFEDSQEECDRVMAAGGRLGRLHDTYGSEVGPLRCWPGGLCLSRSIGDADVGACVTAVPDVRLFQLPLIGGRIICASDGVWDALSNKHVVKLSKGRSVDDLCRKVVKDTLKARGLRDDTTVLVIDILPHASVLDSFAALALNDKSTSKKNSVIKLFGRKKKAVATVTVPSGPMDPSVRGLHSGMEWCTTCASWTVCTEASTRAGAFYCINHQGPARHHAAPLAASTE
eukprot:jgi/Chlat1/9177/Chrsp97S08450